MYQFIDFVLDVTGNSDNEMDRKMLCDFCEFNPNCSEQDDCREGIYKYLAEENN